MKTNGQKPQLPPFDLERLAKLLQMTQSEQPGEALVAIRKANEYLKRYDLNWPEFFVRLRNSHRAVRQQAAAHQQSAVSPDEYLRRAWAATGLFPR